MSTLPSEDPYKVLGVPKDATKEAIRSAHRKLVLQSHPDKIQDASLRAQKQDEFQRVQEAYELLSDESRRQQYDETVKLAELRRQVDEERAAKAARRYESPRHSPREFDDRSKRVYEERTHTRSYDDERPRSYEDRSASKKYDTFEARRPARSFEDKDRKSTSRAEDDERVYAERERKREAERVQQSERRRARDRERRRGHDDKQARVTAYHSDDDMAEAMHHIRITSQSEKARADNDRARDEEERRIQEKILAAREYMERARRGSEDILPRPSPTRSHTTYYATTAHPAPPPPIPVEDSTIRRSTARRTTEGGRERRRETSRPRSRGKDSRDSRPTMIVDPPSKTYERVKVITVPHSSSSTSSPAGLEIPTASSRSYHSHSRSGPAMAQAMKPQRAATTLDPVRPRVDPIPTFSRSNTTPVVSTTPRKETVTSSGKLKEKTIRPLGEAGFDSGYSSAAPDSPYLGSGGRLSSSPTNRYTEYRSSPKTKGFPESKIYDEPEYVPRRRTVLRETDEEYTRSRSVSPAAPRPRRGSESSSRPRPSASTVEYASNGRPIKYVHPAESRAPPPPPPMRSQTLDTPSRRVVPEKVHYSARIGKEDISYSPPYTTTRRTTSHAPSHYVRPSYPRAETTYV